MEKQLRLPPEVRREELLKVAVDFVRTRGWPPMTCRALAAAAGCSYSTVWRLFPNRRLLGEATTRYASINGATDVAKSGKRMGYA
jgi:AcrR family transcriptional regulator